MAIETLDPLGRIDIEPVLWPDRLPIVPFDHTDQQLLQDELRILSNGERSLAHFTVRFINSVSLPEGKEPTIRWLAAVAELGRFFQELKNMGVTPPQRVEFISPIYQSAAVNKVDPQKGAELATKLHQLATAFLNTFFLDEEAEPLVPTPELVFDSPDDVKILADLSETHLKPKLDQIDPRTKAFLLERSGNHSNSSSSKETRLIESLAYLSGHLISYGQAINTGSLATTDNIIIICPHSEAPYYHLSDELMRLESDFLQPGNNVVIRTILPAIRRAHYLQYFKEHPHVPELMIGEPTLTDAIHRFPALSHLNHIILARFLRPDHQVAIEILHSLFLQNALPHWSEKKAIGRGISKTQRMLKQAGFKPASTHDSVFPYGSPY